MTANLKSIPFKMLLCSFTYILSLGLVQIKTFSQANASKMKTIPLNQNWTFYQVGEEIERSAKVPGCVHEDLLIHKLIPDPFYRGNEDSVQWVEKKDWVYTCRFDVEASFVEQYQNIAMSFKGLDTYADVTLNDVSILNSDNMFRSYEIDCKKLLKQGTNILKIYFKSPLTAAEADWKALGYELPGGIRTVTHKAAFHYGWDWGPRLVTSGVWRPIELLAWNNVRISDVFVHQHEIKSDTAFTTTEVEVDVTENGRYTIEAGENETMRGYITQDLKAGKNLVKISTNIPHPKLWWTYEWGEPYRYDFKVVVRQDLNILCEHTQKLGLRTIKLIQTPDSKGKTFYFELNGKPIFAKGANYIPQHSFQSMVTKIDYDTLIQDVLAANMNMLRVWGGGIYEEDYFYELCDEKGILVWQDFMFACAMHPGNDKYIDNVEQEAIQNVKRIRKYASVALWCGNNEIREAWKNWGWKDQFTTAQVKTISEGYHRLFNEMLPAVVGEYGGGVDYWESSPSYGRYDPKGVTEGDSHYWGVWHDAEPFEIYETAVPRFMSEFGFQAFPTMRTIEAYTLPEDRDINSPVMKVHQKHPRGNALIEQYMKMYYNKPDSFEDFMYISQVMQAEGIAVGIGAHRRARPICMGSLYWQLNDCWPVASWASRDSYGRWKALHYAVKKAFEPIYLSFQRKGNHLSVFAISDLLQDIDASFEIKTYSFDGKVFYDDTKSVKVFSNSSQAVYDCSLNQAFKDLKYANGFIKATLKSGDGKIIAEQLFYAEKPKDLNLPKINIKYEVAKTDNNHFNIKLSSDTLAKNVFISTEPEAFIEDNYFDLQPGQTRQINARTKDNTDSLVVKVRSISDTYTQKKAWWKFW